MRGEDGLQPELRGGRAQIVVGDVVAAQVLGDRGQRARGGVVILGGAHPAAAHPMRLFGHVDQQEVGQEGAPDVGREVERPAGHQRRHLLVELRLGGAAHSAPAAGEAAQGLDGVVDALALDRRDGLPQQVAEQAYVPCEGRIDFAPVLNR